MSQEVELCEESLAHRDADLKVADFHVHQTSKIGDDVMLYRHTSDGEVDLWVGLRGKPIIIAGTAALTLCHPINSLDPVRNALPERLVPQTNLLKSCWDSDGVVLF